MGAQGDQAAPKAPKLKPKDAQGLPKVLQRHPKIPKVAKICQKWFKSSKNGSKNEPKIVQNRQKNIRRNWNDFGEDIQSKIFDFLVDFASPDLRNTLEKQGFWKLFRFLTFWDLKSFFDRLLIDFQLQNESNFEKNKRKFDPKFKLEFEGPILEIFGYFWGILEGSEKIFESLNQLGGARAASEGEGEAKAQPLGYLKNSECSLTRLRHPSERDAAD